MSRLAVLFIASAMFSTQAGAQTPDPHAAHRAATPVAQPADPHAGHVMPAAPAADPHAGHTMPTPAAAAADPHAGHNMPAAPAADPHAGHVMPGVPSVMSGAQLPVGTSAPPPPPNDNLADSVYPADQMALARDLLRKEHGGARLSQVMANLAEYQSGPAGGGYRWDVEGWLGGDINRFVLKSEGEGGGREGVHEAEIQALYSRAVTRYTDLQIGLRHDLEPRSVTYLTLGAETLFPYWFEAEGAVFLSQDGDLLGRVEGSYDFRLTEKLILQPSAELEFAAQDVRASDIGSGLSSAELGLRLRYEIRREFAPYVGVSYERSLGRTADFARGNGEDASDTRIVVGLRAWF